MTWSARALVYSGRPDPTWPVSPETVQKLLGIWDRLPPLERPAPPPGGLGYRGTLLTGPDGTTWLGAGGAVRRAPPTEGREAPEYRQDDDHRFERALLDSAPAGLVPNVAR